MLHIAHFNNKCKLCNMGKEKNQTAAGVLNTSSAVFTSAELSRALASRTASNRAAGTAKLVALGAGYYSTPDIDPSVAQVLVVARFYPEAVISTISGLVIHYLSDEKLQKVTVDMPKDKPLR